MDDMPFRDLLDELHAKYVSNKKSAEATARAEAAWTQESSIVRELVELLQRELQPRYSLRKALGVGGVGIVIQIFDSNLEMPRALKFARPTLGRESFFASNRWVRHEYSAIQILEI